MIGNIGKNIDVLFRQWNGEKSPGACALALLNGEIIYNGCFGFADIGRQIPITPLNVFDCASLAKQFTGFAVATLAEQGRLNTGDEARRYLPEFPVFIKPVTIDHLLHHTSGLRDGYIGSHTSITPTIRGIINMVSRQQDLNFSPGDEYEYCNTGYNILAAIVEKITGQSLGAWMNDNVFKPLAMNSSLLRDNPQTSIKNMAFAYSNAGGKRYIRRKLGLWALGSSALFSCAQDLVKWLNNFDEIHVGSRQIFKRMCQRGFLNSGSKVNYGYGLKIDERNGFTKIWHDGAYNGFTSSICFIPRKRIGALVLSNTGSGSVWTMAGQIADICLAGREGKKLPVVTMPAAGTVTKAGGKTIKAPRLNQPSAGLLADYTGKYVSKEVTAIYTIKVKKRQLVIKRKDREKVPSAYRKEIPLKFSASDRFIADPGWMRQVDFTRDKLGRVDGLKITCEWGVRNLRFFRNN